MRKALRRRGYVLHYYNDANKKVEGPHEDAVGKCKNVWGDCTGLWGSYSLLKGDCTGLKGECTGLEGDCSDLIGNLDDCNLTPEERKEIIDINDLAEDEEDD